MHVIPFNLKKAAREFQAGEATGFGISCGIKSRNPTTRQDEWTNYETALFAKTPAAIEFYRSKLVEGALAVVSGDALLVKQFQGQQGLQITLSLQNAKLTAVSALDARQAEAPQQAPRAQPQQPVPQQPAGFDSFDDSIPFMRLHYLA